MTTPNPLRPAPRSAQCSSGARSASISCAAAVGGDQAQAAQVVRGEAVPAAEQAQAAAEGVAGHPDPGRGGGERGQAVRGGGGEDLRPGGAGPDAGRAGPRVDVTASSRRVESSTGAAGSAVVP